MARSEYRNDIKTSLDSRVDSIENDVNEIMSMAEDVQQLLGEGEIENSKLKIVEVIDVLWELADKLY